MMGFDALKKSINDQGGMRATPVHHFTKKQMPTGKEQKIYDPAYTKIGDALREVDITLNEIQMGDPAYDELIAIRGQLLQKKANIDAAHGQLEGRQKGLDAKRKAQDTLINPDVEALERGVIPSTGR